MKLMVRLSQNLQVLDQKCIQYRQKIKSLNYVQKELKINMYNKISITNYINNVYYHKIYNNKNNNLHLI